MTIENAPETKLPGHYSDATAREAVARDLELAAELVGLRISDAEERLRSPRVARAIDHVRAHGARAIRERFEGDEGAASAAQLTFAAALASLDTLERHQHDPFRSPFRDAATALGGCIDELCDAGAPLDITWPLGTIYGPAARAAKLAKQHRELMAQARRVRDLNRLLATLAAP